MRNALAKLAVWLVLGALFSLAAIRPGHAEYRYEVIESGTTKFWMTLEGNSCSEVAEGMVLQMQRLGVCGWKFHSCSIGEGALFDSVGDSATVNLRVCDCTGASCGGVAFAPVVHLREMPEGLAAYSIQDVLVVVAGFLALGIGYLVAK